MAGADWDDCLRRMKEYEELIRSWEPALPDATAARCVQSRHRTLAHLRACQETWLEACIAFDQRQNPRLKMLHPWRLFEQRSYDVLPWADHLEAFVVDRARWRKLLETADRSKAGKLNDREHSIESLTQHLVSHEYYHLFAPK